MSSGANYGMCKTAIRCHGLLFQFPRQIRTKWSKWAQYLFHVLSWPILITSV
jgi:hypothetical protein